MNMKNAINVNLSTSGRRLGGAAIASEFHSRHMAEHFPVQLWRMWDRNEDSVSGKLKIRNFLSHTKLGILEQKLPKRVRSSLLDSSILVELLALQPAIVHLHNPLPSLAFENIARRTAQAGIKVVASTHGFFEVMYPHYNFKPYETWLWERTVTNPIVRSLQYMDAIFTLYPDESNMLIERGFPAEKIHLISNGVNPFFLDLPTQEDCDAVITKFKLNIERPILLFIGNHTSNKGLDTVMQVASQLSQPATVVVGGKLLSPDEPQQWRSKLPNNPNVDIVFTDYLSLVFQTLCP
jgi:alpha-maltose-1-phosphate synthase